MHKRKNLGIIKYGPRLSKNKLSIKFQQGGFVSVSSGYNWREDPYELMLLKQEQAGGSGRGYGSGRKSSGSGSSSTKLPKDPKVPKFELLTGGLTSSRNTLNSLYAQEHNKFQEKARTVGTSWLASYEGQNAYNDLMNRGIQYQSALDSEKEDFDNASKGLTVTEKDVYAISSNNNTIMVRDRETGKAEEKTMADYTANVESYVPMKLSDFIEWKKKEDTSIDSNGLINRYINNRALSPEKAYETYIEPKEDSINYIVNKGMISEKTDKGVVPIDSINNWKEVMHTISKNGLSEYYKNNADQAAVYETMFKSIYTSVMSSTEDGSRLAASLDSELLHDNMFKAALYNVPKAGRPKFMQDQRNILLVSKVMKQDIFKGEEAEKSKSTTIKNPYLGVLADISTGVGSDMYTIGANTGIAGDSDNRVVTTSLPTQVGAISPAKLNIATTPEEYKKNTKNNNLITNTETDKMSYTNIIYAANGEKAHNISGVTPTQFNSYVQKNTALAPSANANVVFLPFRESDNSVLLELLPLVDKYRLNSKEAFLKVNNELASKFPKSGIKKINLEAGSILPGGNTKAKQDAYRRYTTWLADGTEDNVAKLQKELNTSKTRDAAIRLAMANTAFNQVNTLAAIMEKNYKGIIMAPMLQTTNIVDSEGDIDFKTDYIENAKAKGFGEHLIKDVTDGGYKDHMNEVMDIDNFSWNPAAAEYQETVFYTRIKSLSKMLSEGIDETTKASLDEASAVEREYLDNISKMSALSTPSVANVLKILM